MSDLISRSALIKELQKCFVNNAIHKNDLAEVIANAPTAYDVDKVVNTLRDRKAYFESCFEKSDSAYDIGKFMAYGDAAEIVRRGGIE